MSRAKLPPYQSKTLRRWIVIALVMAGVFALASSAWIPVKAKLAQVLIAHVWAQRDHTGTALRPWPWADVWPVARLQIPALASDWYVMSGSSGQALAFGPGHLSASAAPGRRGVTAIAGHRDTHFAALERVALNDSLWLESANGERLRYQVVDLNVVDTRQQGLYLPSGDDEDSPRQLLLISCYPFDAVLPGGPLRYVVSAVAAPVNL